MIGRVRDFAAALTCRLMAHALFRIRVIGGENIPSRGPALLVSNHLTHLDGFLIGACLRPAVRFVVWKPYYDHKLLHWGLRFAKAIPIWTTHRAIAEAIGRARRELERREVVCIFAEGSISRTGDLLPFGRGVEAIARGLDIPIIPVHLGGLWSSIFSYRGGRFFCKRPHRLRHLVTVSFAAPVPARSTADEIREEVQRLKALSSVTR